MSWPWVFFLHQFICNPFQSNLCNESVTAETETDWAEVQVILNIIMIFYRNYSNRNTTRSYHLDSHHLFLSKYINGMWIEQKCHRNKRNYHQNIITALRQDSTNSHERLCFWCWYLDTWCWRARDLQPWTRRRGTAPREYRRGIGITFVLFYA